MKHRPIQQFEMAFTAEAFNLAGQAETVKAVEPARILAEMTPEERETVREQSKAEVWPVAADGHNGAQTAKCRVCFCPIASTQVYCGGVCRQRQERIDARKACQKREEVFHLGDSMPGLAPGSRWTSEPMAKALATMQGGGL